MWTFECVTPTISLASNGAEKIALRVATQEVLSATFARFTADVNRAMESSASTIELHRGTDGEVSSILNMLGVAAVPDGCMGFINYWRETSATAGSIGCVVGLTDTLFQTAKEFTYLMLNSRRALSLFLAVDFIGLRDENVRMELPSSVEFSNGRPYLVREVNLALREISNS